LGLFLCRLLDRRLSRLLASCFMTVSSWPGLYRILDPFRSAVRMMASAVKGKGSIRFGGMPLAVLWQPKGVLLANYRF